MATLRQKKLAENIVLNAESGFPLNKQELVESSGYTPAQAEKKAGEIIDSKGTQEELAKLGFDIESAKKVAIGILKNGKEENKVRIIQEIFKVNGEYAPEKHLVVTSKVISVDE